MALTTASFRRLEPAALAMVLGLGLALRLAHFHFFLPWFYYLDEMRTIHVALRLLQERTLNPHYDLFPALTIYLHAGAAFLYLLFRHLPAVWESADLAPVFAAAGQLDDQNVNLILVGRGLSLLAGTAAIYFVYRLARDFLGTGAGLLAALFFALNPINITFSHLAKPDIFLTLWTTLGFFAAGRVITDGRLRWSALTGLAMGLGLATKYDYLPVVFVALAHLSAGSRRGLTLVQTLGERRFLLFLAVTLGVTLLGTPYWLWNLGDNLQTVGWIYQRSQIMSFYHLSDDAWWHDRYFYALLLYWPFLLGLPLAALSLPGFLLHARATRTHGFLLWAYPPCQVYLLSSQIGGSIPYYAFISAVPFGIMAAVFTLQRLAAGPGLVRKSAAGVLLALSLGYSFAAVNSYRDYFFGPYDQARTWLAENLPAKAKVVLVSPYFLGPAFSFQRESIWPHLVTESWLKEHQPDYLLVDTRSLGGFRKFYRTLWVAPLFDRLLSGQLGYQVIQRFPTRYTGKRYFGALDVEHDTELVVLKREEPR